MISLRSFEKQIKLNSNMKQYTNQDQTAKLIELGFPEPSPKYIHIGGVSYDSNHNYSIGELIGLLPRWIKFKGGIEMVAESDGWLVMHGHDPFDPYCKNAELIDALYEYCVKLKNEGAI